MSARIVLADDQELIRNGFRMILEQAGHEVVGDAADGLAAVEMAQALRPDVVLMDVRMPVMDGIEATRRLAGPDIDDPVRVLVLTTFDLDEHVYDSLRAGASGYILKDTPTQQLLHAIDVRHQRPSAPGPHGHPPPRRALRHTAGGAEHRRGRAGSVDRPGTRGPAADRTRLVEL